MKPKVSIIVPTFNRIKDLTICLKSVFAQKFSSFEIIVVDDASTDSTKEILRKQFSSKKLVYLRNQKRAGVSKTKNRALKVAQGKYCWFLDSDTKVLSKNCLSFLYQTLEKNPRTGSLGCEIISRGKERLVREHSFFGIDKTFKFKGSRSVKSRVCDYSATCNCFARLDLVKKIGGFNELYFYGYEDAELGKKIADLGYENIIDSEAAVLHVRSSVSRTANYKYFFKNRIRFALWNFSFFQVLKLPIIDLQNFIVSLNMAKGVKSTEVKGQSSSKINKSLGKLGMLLEYFWGLAYGYFWNLIFLPKTLFLDKKRNFLTNE